MKNLAFRVVAIGAIATFLLVGLATGLSGGQQGSMAASERQQAMQHRVAAQEARMTNGTVSGAGRWRAPEYEAVAALEPPMAPSRDDWREEYEDVRATPIPGPRVVYEGDARSDDRDAWRDRLEERRRQEEAERLVRALDARLYDR